MHSNTGTSLERPSGSRAGDLTGEVRRVFAELTRYPVEVLEPHADLEEELGLDSVKLGEILSALRERFQLPPIAEIRTRFPPEHLRTIAGVSEVVATLGSPLAGPAEAAAPAAPAAPAPAEPVAPASGSAQPETAAPLLDEVRRVFAELTRYPVDILAADADLEEDLGIDSVKLGEIFSVLRERYSLPPRNELRDRIQPEELRTIAGISGIVGRFGDTGGEAAPAPAAAAAPPPVPQAPSKSPVTAPPAGAISGLEHLREMMERRQPVSGFALADVAAGRVVLTADAIEAALVSALLDSAMASAVRTTLAPGADCTTLALQVQFVRPFSGNGTLRCEGLVLHAAGRVVAAQGVLLDAQGALYAHATGTCLVTESR